jgi:hypothetical protein
MKFSHAVSPFGFGIIEHNLYYSTVYSVLQGDSAKKRGLTMNGDEIFCVWIMTESKETSAGLAHRGLTLVNGLFSFKSSV